jgi:hypothetical protein
MNPTLGIKRFVRLQFFGFARELFSPLGARKCLSPIKKAGFTSEFLTDALAALGRQELDKLKTLASTEALLSRS